MSSLVHSWPEWIDAKVGVVGPVNLYELCFPNRGWQDQLFSSCRWKCKERLPVCDQTPMNETDGSLYSSRSGSIMLQYRRRRRRWVCTDSDDKQSKSRHFCSLKLCCLKQKGCLCIYSSQPRPLFLQGHYIILKVDRATVMSPIGLWSTVWGLKFGFMVLAVLILDVNILY